MRNNDVFGYITVNFEFIKQTIISMLLSFLLIVCAYTQIVPPTQCPGNSHGYIQSSLVTLSSLTIGYNTIPDTESEVYDYTLTNSFLNSPQVIIGIGNFQSISSPYLMISIKPLPSTSLAAISFLLRFHYRYTTWRLISFYFLAEDRSDISANYYEIDTRELATSNWGKAIQVQLPFNFNFQNFTVLYLLSGMEIASIQTSSNSNFAFSPFQVQLISISQTSQGVTLVISATTQTQVYSLLISYLAYDSSSSWFSSGNYSYSSLTTASYFSIPLDVTSTPLLFFGGINGFIMPNTQGNTQFSSNFLNNTLQFQLNPAFNYLTFHYFIVYTPESSCFYCQNAPYQYQNTCVTSCPANTEVHSYFCATCSDNQIWNGSNCLSRCFGGQVWDQALQTCNCPSGSYWNGASCVFCPFGQTWSSVSLKCGCPNGQYWNSYACTPTPSCPGSQVYDTVSFMCACPLNTNWNGTSCISCSSGYVWSYQTNGCVCSDGSYYNGYQCIICSGGMVFDNVNYICQCPTYTAWNGANCVNSCQSPFVFSNGQCQCPPGTTPNLSTCITTPTCPSGSVWFNSKCSNITCSPGYLWNGNSCTQFVPSCPLNTYWNGITCASYNIQCPTGSYWNGTYCIPTSSNCSIGSYLSNGICIPFSQQCLPNYVWNGTSCLLVGITSCSSGQYYNGSVCVNASCSNGQVWNSTLSQCVCPSSAFWNGQQCIQCPFGQFYSANGCTCLDGYFLVDGTCYNLQQIYCSMVNYAQWSGQNCICNPGFDPVGLNCVCNGLIVNNSCSKCYNIPNSDWVNGTCTCNSGFYSSMGQCLPYQNISTPGTTLTCNPGTLKDTINRLCLPCVQGCLSCLTQNICLQCRLQFTYNWATYHCDQICGDGKRFTLPCDDGNNINGDGCSADCRIQSQFTCYGGSPNSPDFCTMFLPSQIVLNLTGTTHLYGKIIANVRANYLPSNLTDPSMPCSQICQQILQANVTGFNSYTSISTQYLIGSAGFSFSVTVDFGQEPIGVFTLTVGINPAISGAYFPGVNASQTFSFSINPAFLSIAGLSDDKI